MRQHHHLTSTRPDGADALTAILALLLASWSTRAADLLTWWRDPDTYLPWLANEDDNMVFSQGLQGAGTTFGALRAAAMAARALGNVDDAERWELRAAEVRWAIEHHLYEEGVGFIENVTENPGSAAGHP